MSNYAIVRDDGTRLVLSGDEVARIKASKLEPVYEVGHLYRDANNVVYIGDRPYEAGKIHLWNTTEGTHSEPEEWINRYGAGHFTEIMEVTGDSLGENIVLTIQKEMQTK